MSGAYYNEIDEYCAAWLRNLISAGHIAGGDVDTRSIEDVRPDDLRGYTQCHFFAGIGVWSAALRLAGWSDDRPVWTGSCPCQPFSAAGKGAGFADERHLWPAWHWLVQECRPSVILGEQVASADGLGWLDLVQADLEATGYASAAVDLCAAGVGAPHIRQRLWFVGHANDSRLSARQRTTVVGTRGRRQGRAVEQPGGAPSRVADMHGNGCEPRSEGFASVGHRTSAESDRRACRLADTDGRQCDGLAVIRGVERDRQDAGRAQGRRQPQSRREPNHLVIVDADTGVAAGPTNGFWRDADWLLCRDGKWRPVEPGTFPLAHGAPARVGRLRAYGNAINRQAAATFIQAAMMELV